VSLPELELDHIPLIPHRSPIQTSFPGLVSLTSNAKSSGNLIELAQAPKGTAATPVVG